MVLTQQCSFSGRHILPGYGKRYVRLDKSVVIFLNRKSAIHYANKWNPRKIRWTITSRRHHGKEVILTAKRRVAHKAIVSTRGYSGADHSKLETLRQKFAMK